MTGFRILRAISETALQQVLILLLVILWVDLGRSEDRRPVVGRRDDPAASSSSDPSRADRRALGTIFNDRHIVDAVDDVRARAAALPLSERYRYLSDWVLPSDDHLTIRTALDFTPSNPAPPVSDSAARSETEGGSGVTRKSKGGKLISPAWDLVVAAKQLGRLEQLRERVEQLDPADNHQRRAGLCMLSLIEMADDDFGAANRSLRQLVDLVYASNHTSFVERRPETLAIAQAAQFPETQDLAREMAMYITITQIRESRPSGSRAWEQHMRAWASRLQYAAARNDDTFQNLDSHPLANWIPVSRDSSRSRGEGFPPADWERSSPATVSNVESHQDDYLFYRIPLRGDYEVECDVNSFGWRQTNLWVAGKWLGAVNTRRHFDIGNWHGSRRLPLNPMLHKMDDWMRYRAVVRDGTCTVYLNGRRIHARTLADDHDPWVAVRSPDNTNGAVRNLRITGTPDIPSEVRLAASGDLEGWCSYFGEEVGAAGKWQPLTGDGGGIFGTRLSGTAHESLLRYHRPMAEDGTIEYEFYYREGTIHVYPALDRLAFLLSGSGVRIHWITDGAYDRTGLDPGNLFDEPGNRRGGAELPLKQDAWNRLRLSLTGDVIELALNGEPIYERRIEPENHRTFGLFHYSDRTEAQVRNLVWRGNWPRTLPPAGEQELAGDETRLLDDSLSQLSKVFHYNFAKQGYPSKDFRLIAGEPGQYVAQPDGLHVTRPGAWGFNYTTIAPNLGIEGDFDIVASFERFEPQPARKGCHGAICLHAQLESEESNECLIFRKDQWFLQQPRAVVHGAYNTRETGDVRRAKFPVTTVEAGGGRLRLARRGDTVFYLFAENDSPNFRLLGTQTATTDDVLRVGLTTEALGDGLTRVIWKSLTVRAHKFTGPEKWPEIKALAKQLTGELPSSALEFDGRTHYVTVPSIRYDGSYPITLEAFVTPDQLRACIVGDTQAAGIGVNLYRQNYNIIASHGNNYDGARADVFASRYLRVHVAGTFDGKTLQVFVNGKLEKSAQLIGKFNPSGLPMTIGASPSNKSTTRIDQPLDGILDEVRISKTIRYTEDFQVPTSFTADQHTLALYRFDEGRGQKLTDASGNEHDGELQGAQWVTDAAIRKRAALGLTEFGQQAVPVFADALDHPNRIVQLEAIAALEAIGQDAKAAVPALKKLTAADDRGLSDAALRALLRIESSTP